MATSTAEAIRAYLESLGRQKKQGRKGAGIDALRRRLLRVQGEIPEAAPLRRLHLFQQEIDLKNRIRALNEPQEDLRDLEEAFVAEVASWAGHQKVSYQALRAAGVRAEVLRRGGMAP